MAVTRHSDAVAPVRSSGPISIWFLRHISTSIGSLGRLFRQPFASLMIILVIAVTLFAPLRPDKKRVFVILHFAAFLIAPAVPSGLCSSEMTNWRELMGLL